MQVLTSVSAFTRADPCAYIGRFVDHATFVAFADSGTLAPAGKRAGFAQAGAPDSPIAHSRNRKRSLSPVDDAVHDPGES